MSQWFKNFEKVIKGLKHGYGNFEVKIFCCQTICDQKKWVFVNQIENKTGPFILIGPKIALTTKK